MKDRRGEEEDQKGERLNNNLGCVLSSFLPVCFGMKVLKSFDLSLRFPSGELEKECNLSLILINEHRSRFPMGREYNFCRGWIKAPFVVRIKEGEKENDTENYYYFLLFQNTTRHLIRYTKITRDASKSR